MISRLLFKLVLFGCGMVVGAKINSTLKTEDSKKNSSEEKKSKTETPE